MSTYYLTVLISCFTAFLAQIMGRKRVANDLANSEAYRPHPFFTFVTGAILTFVAGFRWHVGADYIQYSENYYRYILNVWNDIQTLNEPGLKVIAKVSSWLYNDYVTMFVIASIITVGLSVRTISKYSNMFVLSILLYIFIGSWHGSFNAVRQFLACAVIFAGHRYIIDRKLVKYVFVVLLAALFHRSALIMLFLYFVPSKRLDVRHFALMVFATIALSYSYDVLFGLVGALKGTHLGMTDYITREVNFLRTAVKFAPIPIYLLFTSKKDLSAEDHFYINVLVVNAALALITSKSAYLARVAIYTNVYTTLSFPRLLKTSDKKMAQYIKLGAILLYSVYWYVDVAFDPALQRFYWVFYR